MMGRQKKDKGEMPEIVADDTLSFAENDVKESTSIEYETGVDTYRIIESEIDFLTKLLDTQLSGNWHGPAASMIKERLKLLK